MKKFYTGLLSFFCLSLFSQPLLSPSEFLGYELGTQFTRHHDVVDYYEQLAKSAPDRVKLISYGKTNERRPLLLAFVSSAENMANLEAIREAHLASTTGGNSANKAIVWLSYNVHGNESVSTEASMLTIYELLTQKSDYLENTVVIMDPCINPDGRDRYVNWYNQYKNTPFNVDPNSKEHHEGWWSGRSNHYMFDLNRDWAWLTQVESQQRLKKFNEWLPHIHVDFHEQGVNNPYFFAPAAQPYHEVITQFQRDFQETIGRNHARYFDANGWFYFTKEVFDLFYPSYGDTYPTYNGGIGMTYEQGGSGRAGLGIITAIKDTLTLQDRISHHHTTGLSTVEVAKNNESRLNAEFRKFYQRKNFKYKSYLLDGGKDQLAQLASLLDKHQIKYGKGSGVSAKGYNYKTGKNGSLRGGENSLVISSDQTKGTLVKVLFEPDAQLVDSLTYDITAWSLPYAYGLNAIASESDLGSGSGNWEIGTAPALDVNAKEYAYVADWNSMNDARFLADLLKGGIRVRKAHKPFQLEGNSYARGSLIITHADNERKPDYLNNLKDAALKNNKTLTPVQTGFVDSGKDFGSFYVDMIPKAKIALLGGDPSSTLRFGEIWHFFEQQLHYPVTVIDADYINGVDLADYDVLILPDGRGYGEFITEDRLKEVKSWVREGGRLIAMGRSIKAIDGEKGFSIKLKEAEKKESEDKVAPFDSSQREQMKSAITGAIFKTKVDTSNPLAYGYGDTYFTLKLGNDSYKYLKRGTAVYLEDQTKPFSGFAGSEAQKKLDKTLVFGLENHGRGEVVYMVDNPLFRAFWEGGKLFFANALFMLD